MKEAKNQEENGKALQEDTYMILLDGDHADEIRQYLNYLVTEAE